MCKENLEVKGFIINVNGEKVFELNNLEVSMKPIVKIENGKEKTERYIGIVKFETKENIKSLDNFNIEGICDENKERIKITGCRNIVEIENKRYITNFNVKNVEIG